MLPKVEETCGALLDKVFPVPCQAIEQAEDSLPTYPSPHRRISHHCKLPPKPPSPRQKELLWLPQVLAWPRNQSWQTQVPKLPNL